MGRWKELLEGFGGRPDRDESFYNERLEAEGPVLLNRIDVLSAAFIGARLLRAIARRRGTLVSESAAKSMESLVARGLSREARHHCEAEAERILRWIEDPPASDEAPEIPPALGIMVDADLASRRSVATFARAHGYALELEYYDEERDHWPRLRAAVVEVDEEEPHELVLEVCDEREPRRVSIPLRHIRWLMPVAPPEGFEEELEAGGDVIEFPGTWSD